MRGGVLELVFLFVVENDAVFFDKTDYWRLPAGTFQEGNQAIEDPILSAQSYFGVFNLRFHLQQRVRAAVAMLAYLKLII